MRIPFTEPTSPRYIYINQETNLVHLMVPIVSGQDISIDNTCQARKATEEFFEFAALRELTAYQHALKFDISILEEGSSERAAKEARLVQINIYIETISILQDNYGGAIDAILKKPSNLYGIQLRPFEQDPQSRVINPVFNIDRTNDNGRPLSALFNEMHESFARIVLPGQDPRKRLITAALSALPQSRSASPSPQSSLPHSRSPFSFFSSESATTNISPEFEEIQRVLGEQTVELFGLSIDFTQHQDGTPVTQERIKMDLNVNDLTPEDYMEALVGTCAPNLLIHIPTSPFYSIQASGSTGIERLSILTQFFLANVNIYCVSKQISAENFGVCLDSSSDLSHRLVKIIADVLTQEGEIEEAICQFINQHQSEFGLVRPLICEDIKKIKEKFEQTYRTVTGTNENPHMDDFLILDREATDESAKFVTYQGAISVNFAEIADPHLPHQEYFMTNRAGFKTGIELPTKNEWIADETEIDIAVLLSNLNDDQFNNIPHVIKNILLTHPAFQTRQFLSYVARGKQDEAEALLLSQNSDIKKLLTTPGVFTDYSGRTFHCTAYEYAYWCKDTYMRRMLEQYMDEETKSHLYARIEEIEHTGLSYQQHGEAYSSSNFDLSTLRGALQTYVDGFNVWVETQNFEELHKTWLMVGQAQRDLPAHVAQEYCRRDQTFLPPFDGPKLPRGLLFYNQDKGVNESWFNLSGPHVDLGGMFAITRGEDRLRRAWNDSPAAGVPWVILERAEFDLNAIVELDSVRTTELSISKESLNPSTHSSQLSR